MPSLSPLIGNPVDTATLPGHALSRGTLGQWAAFEDHLASRHLALAEVQVASCTSSQAEVIRQRAAKDVADDLFQYGGPAFGEAVADPAMVPVMLWINLRVREPDLAFAEASALVTDDNVARLHVVLAQLWNYRMGVGPAEDAPRRKTNWRHVVHSLRHKSNPLTPAEIADLTMDRLQLELTADPDKVSADQAAKDRRTADLAKRAKGFAVLDDVCKRFGPFTPAQLANQPLHATAKAIDLVLWGDRKPDNPTDVARLPALLADYVKFADERDANR